MHSFCTLAKLVYGYDMMVMEGDKARKTNENISDDEFLGDRYQLGAELESSIH